MIELSKQEQALLDNAMSNINNPEPELIPENSPTLDIKETTARFSGAPWFEEVQNTPILIAGVGGIGSNLAYLMSRLSPRRMVLYDPDEVDIVNMAGQLYSMQDIGEYKVNALYSTILKFSDYHTIFTHPVKFKDTDKALPVSMCGFDNMEARKTLFKVWKKYYMGDKEALFVDGRLNSEEFQIFCIRGDDEYNIKKYEEEFLFDDSDVAEAPCSYKQTSFSAMMIASYMTNLFVNHITNLKYPDLHRDLPFYTGYDCRMMYLKTKN